MPSGVVGGRAHRDLNSLRPSGGERQIPRPVAAAAAAGQRSHHRLGCAPRREVAVAVGEAHDRIGVGHVDEVGVRARRVEGEAEGPVQPLREDRPLCGLGLAIRGPQHGELPHAALGHEDVAVRGDPQTARVLEVLGEELDREPRGRLGPRPRWQRGEARPIAHRRRRPRRGQVSHRQSPPNARRALRSVITLRGRAGAQADRALGRSGSPGSDRVGCRRGGGHRQARQESDQRAPIRLVRDPHRHPRPRNKLGRIGEIAIQGRRVPVQPRRAQRLRVPVPRDAPGRPPDHAPQTFGPWLLPASVE